MCAPSRYLNEYRLAPPDGRYKIIIQEMASRELLFPFGPENRRLSLCFFSVDNLRLQEIIKR